MKRKRGIAKRKPKLASLRKEEVPNIINANTQDECYLANYATNEFDNVVEVEPPQISNQLNPRGALRNEDVAEERTTSLFAELNAAVSTNLPKKSRSILSKSTKGISSSSTGPISNGEKVQIQGTCEQVPSRDPDYREEELQSALKVIRKVMKMDAAEPFNTPVDPVALGIPDYFNIIHTPMDFGTICCNIENGIRYKNSKDVMRDVQLIWDNCCKYNRKGHFILELMKRVKKNFMKFWTEAGLCREQEQETDDTRVPFVKSTPTSSIYGQRNPMSSLANCVRSLHQHQEDASRYQYDQPSLTRAHSYKSLQRPDQLDANVCSGEANNRRSSHDCAADLIDNTQPKRMPHEIQQCQSSRWNSEPYQAQQRPCNCYMSPLQPQHSHQQVGTCIASTGHQRATPIESSVRENPYGRRFPVSSRAENFMYSSQNQISRQLECHEHQPSQCCSQLCQSRRESCHCLQCSGEQHPSKPFAGTGSFDSYPSEHCNVSYTKQMPRYSKAPSMTDYINHQQRDEKASSCLHKPQPSESCGHESMITVSEHGPVKIPAVPMMETKNKELDEATPNQKLLFSPEDLWDMYHAVSGKNKQKTGIRGPTRRLDVWDTDEKIPITTNEFGEPIGVEAPKLISFLGIIARNGHIAPLTYIKWKALPDENKEKMWQLVQSKFDINPECKIWILKSIATKWSAWKALLKVNHYTPHKTDEERLADCNERVLPEQWHALVSFWNSPEAQARSNIAKANRAHQKLSHAAGSKSFARLREEERLKRPDGKEPSQADLFILTRTRKGGQPVNEATSVIISQLRDAAQQQEASQLDTIEDDVYVQVMGEEKSKHKRVRNGLDSHSDVSGSKSIPPEAEKIVSEAKAEVLEMKEKMVAVEQTCAQMAAQMAAMMSMMQRNFSNNNPPNDNTFTNPDESENASASRNDFPSPQNTATKKANKRTVGKVASRKP